MPSTTPPRSLRDRFLAGLARQLGAPAGLRGRAVLRALNRGNHGLVLAAVDAAQAAPGGSVADLGFGGGVGLRPLLDATGPDGRVHGVELSETALAQCRRRLRRDVASGRLDLRSGDLAALPLEDASLDAAITVNTVYFVEDLRGVLTELARVLRPGGRAVIGVADAHAMEGLPFTRFGFHLRPAEELADSLRAAGFTEVRDERVGSGDGAPHLLVAERPAL